MYKTLVIENTICQHDGIVRFFNNHTWPVSAIPDPKYSEPQRYAILAVLPYHLILAFNWLIERNLSRDSPAIIYDEKGGAEGSKKVLEEEPSWVRKVPRLEVTLVNQQ